MKPLRHRLRIRIALVAMLALLWSQTALAWHAMCTMDMVPQAAAAVMMQMDGHTSACHDEAPRTQADASLCDSHCDQGAPSPDIARIPALPALPAWVPSGTLAQLPLATTHTREHVEAPPPIPWNGPTPHPSALLLI